MLRIIVGVVLALVALVVVWKLLSVLIGLAWAAASVLVVLAVVFFVIGLVRRLVGV